MHSFRKSSAVLLVVGAVLIACGPAAAASGPSNAQWLARADAICADAARQVARFNPLYPAARAARLGDRVVAIDRKALARLHALAVPRSERAAVARLLGRADAAVGGLANAVAKARTGDQAAFARAARRAQALIDAGHAAARAYGLSACARW